MQSSASPTLPGISDPVARLSIQAAAWAPAAGALLDRIGVAPGWSCLDLGSGPLGILDLLSDRVGRRGLVVGIERDPLALLAAMLAATPRSNVRLVPGDARQTALPGASFDLVHARLVAQEAGVGSLLREMIRLARPGGVVVLAEPGPDPWRIEPAPPGYQRLAPRVTRSFLRRRSALGPTLAERLRRAGLVRVGSRSARLAFRGGHPYATVPLFALRTARPALLQAGVATRSGLMALEADLARAAVDPTVRHRTFRLWMVWGRLPRRARARRA